MQGVGFNTSNRQGRHHFGYLQVDRGSSFRCPPPAIPPESRPKVGPLATLFRISSLLKESFKVFISKHEWCAEVDFDPTFLSGAQRLVGICVTVFRGQGCNVRICDFSASQPGNGICHGREEGKIAGKFVLLGPD